MTPGPKTQNHSDIPQFVAVDRLNDGLMIEFEGGHHALFSYAFLHAQIVESEQRNEHQVDVKASAT